MVELGSKLDVKTENQKELFVDNPWNVVAFAESRVTVRPIEVAANVYSACCFCLTGLDRPSKLGISGKGGVGFEPTIQEMQAPVCSTKLHQPPFAPSDFLRSVGD
jgi:hypothetical protein